MAYDFNITKAHGWFSGEDKPLLGVVYAPEATDAEIVAGTAERQNITGWTLKWVLTPIGKPSPVLISKDTDAGITITDAEQGEYTITVPDTDTDALEGYDTPAYAHQVSRIDAGNEGVISTGTVVLRQGRIL